MYVTQNSWEKKYISDLSGVKWRGKSEIKYEKVK